MTTKSEPNSSHEHNVAWAKAEVAAKSAIGRAVDRSLRPNLAHDARNAATRTLIEIGKMIAHVRRDVAASTASKQGWTWQLLHVLDWDNLDVDALDEKGVHIDHRATDKEWSAAEKRLRSAVAAYKRALPDLLWSAQCFEGFPPINFPHDIHQGVELLERALAYRERRSANWKALKSMYGRVRRYDHLRATAMHMLVVIHDLGGRGEHTKLANFIVDKNAHMTPRPCPRFARDDPYDSIRKIRSRSGL